MHTDKSCVVLTLWPLARLAELRLTDQDSQGRLKRHQDDLEFDKN